MILRMIVGCISMVGLTYRNRLDSNKDQKTEQTNIPSQFNPINQLSVFHFNPFNNCFGKLIPGFIERMIVCEGLDLNV